MVEGTDVFIVGGGPAGLAAGIAARSKGFRVTVADGGEPPIDKACGEGLLPDGIEALRSLGVVFRPTEGYSIRGIQFMARESQVAADFPSGQGIGMRREELHRRLVHRAIACGVSLLWKTPVRGIRSEGVLLGEGLMPARWIVGADGIRSRVRRWIGAGERSQNPRGYRYAFRRHYCVRPWSECMEVHWGEQAQAYVTPVDQEEVCVVLLSRGARMRFSDLGEAFPELAQRLKAATHSGGERGAVTATQKLRRVYRGPVALVGDASGSVDAITGEGLSLAFQQALALAEALELGDLSRYQQVHRRLARRPAFMSRLMLLMDGSGSVRERAMRALASDRELFSRLLAVHVGARAEAHLAGLGALLGWRLLAA
jgi:menaquinone-9 beta-reductase